MQIRTLETLVRIIEQNGFSAAAKTMNATQSTVSKALRQLEEHYGVPLIERGKGKLKLTSAGEYVYHRAQRILAEEATLEREIAELKGLKRGQLRIGLPPVGSAILFARVLADFTKLYPAIDIEIIEHGSKKLEGMVLARELDLAATLAPTIPGLATQEVRNEPLVALMPTAEGGGRSSATLKELAAYPVILFESQFALTPMITKAFAAQKLSPKVSARSSQIDLIFELVAAGMGIGFLPKMIAEKRSYSGVSIINITDIKLDWHMLLVWRQKDHLSYAAKEWLRLSKHYHQK